MKRQHKLLVPGNLIYMPQHYMADSDALWYVVEPAQVPDHYVCLYHTRVSDGSRRVERVVMWESAFHPKWEVADDPKALLVSYRLRGLLAAKEYMTFLTAVEAGVKKAGPKYCKVA